MISLFHLVIHTLVSTLLIISLDLVYVILANTRFIYSQFVHSENSDKKYSEVLKCSILRHYIIVFSIYTETRMQRVEGYNYWLEHTEIPIFLIPLDVIAIPGKSCHDCIIVHCAESTDVCETVRMYRYRDDGTT